MINDVINAITVQLYNVFGSKYTIYPNNVKQNIKTPCFIVISVTDEMQNLLGTRKKLNNAICIHYIPDKEDKADINTVKNTLYANMEFITCLNGDVLRGTGMNSTIDNDGEGNVLHFFVNYNFTINSVKPTENYMEEITQKIRGE